MRFGPRRLESILGRRPPTLTFPMSEINLCVYCGVIADTVDHLVPRHLLARAEELGLSLSELIRMKAWIAPACRECNSAIGGQIHPTLEKRRQCAKAHIRRKYRALLRIPDWSEEELAELSPDMRRDVEGAISKRNWVRGRLAWTNPRRNDMDIEAVMRLFKDTVK